MKVTQVHIKAVESIDRMRAIVSIVLDDCLVIHDIRIIDGPNGLFVAMPSRKAIIRCPYCSSKNQLGSRFCNYCGKEQFGPPQGKEPQRKYSDIVHPINQETRQQMEREILEQYALQNMDQFRTPIDD